LFKVLGAVTLVVNFYPSFDCVNLNIWQVIVTENNCNLISTLDFLYLLPYGKEITQPILLGSVGPPIHNGFGRVEILV